MAEHLTKLDWSFTFIVTKRRQILLVYGFVFGHWTVCIENFKLLKEKNERILFFWGKSSRIKRNVSSRKRNKICENRILKAGIFFPLLRDYVIGLLNTVICGEFSYTIVLLWRQWADQFELTMIYLRNVTINTTDKYVRKCSRNENNLRKSFQSENQKYFIPITL